MYSQPIKNTHPIFGSGARNRTVKNFLLLLADMAVTRAVLSRVLAVQAVASISSAWPSAFWVAHILLFISLLPEWAKVNFFQEAIPF